MPTLEGTTLGRYRLTRLLGRGGMAEVYVASDDQLYREVAVKVVHLSREEDVARFRREAELLGPLAHEHILPVFDSGVQGSWHYLVMPYVRSGTLSQRLHTRGPLSPQEAASCSNTSPVRCNTLMSVGFCIEISNLPIFCCAMRPLPMSPTLVLPRRSQRSGS